LYDELLLRPGDLVTDDAADRRAGRRSKKAAAEDIAGDAADDGTCGSTPVLP
jgi:hypothetical protein